eukprot:270559-Rhodomonas_salina.2
MSVHPEHLHAQNLSPVRIHPTLHSPVRFPDWCSRSGLQRSVCAVALRFRSAAPRFEQHTILPSPRPQR